MTLSSQLQGIATVTEGGERLLCSLSTGAVTCAAFLDDPRRLMGPPFQVSRYLVQVTERALQSGYDTIDELLAAVAAVEGRNPPVLESREPDTGRLAIPECRVLDKTDPSSRNGHWISAIDVLVTAGPLQGQEHTIHFDSRVNRNACLLVAGIWPHAVLAVYNAIQRPEGGFATSPETFLVIEPLRQINATSVARALDCGKPQWDQARMGKSLATLPTTKGTIVHALFDRLMLGSSDPARDYDEILPAHLFTLASITDDFFDEEAFRRDVLRHAGELQKFIDQNMHLVENPQLELKRYSATLGIQGRIDALCQSGNRLEILELKTGKAVRAEDHAQVFIYRLMLSEMLRRWQREEGNVVEAHGRILSSIDGTSSPMKASHGFDQVLDARNRLVSMHYSMTQEKPVAPGRYAGFNLDVCRKCPSFTKRRCEDSTVLFGDRPDAPEREDLNYFRHWTRLVERERWAAEQEVMDLLDDGRLEARVAAYRAIAGAQVVPDAGRFTFECGANTSDLEPGNAVLVHTGRISSSTAYHGTVQAVDGMRLQISIPIKNLTIEHFAGKTWTIDRSPGDFTSEASHSALADFLQLSDSGRKQAILLADAGSPLTVPAPAEDLLASLNASQRLAVDRSVTCGRFHLIWGPPGTGKTRVIYPIVRSVEGSVLLGAFTNTAVDKMLGALLDLDPRVRFIRIGRSGDSPELVEILKRAGRRIEDCFSEDLARSIGSVAAMRGVLRTAPVVAATAHRAATSPYLRQRLFDMTIVDEAGQLTEPLTLALIQRARRFVLIGDDRQLPPVTRIAPLQYSMFERLKSAAGRREGTVTLLDTQYRMHPGIMTLANELFYEGRLQAGVSAEQRSPGPGMPPVMWHPVEGPEDAVRTNAAEVSAISEWVSELRRSGDQSSVGIVSPYRAQVALLRRSIDDPRVTIDTVERFQGGERDRILISFVRSSGTSFVFDDRRLNVAMTRARRQLVLFSHPHLFRNTRYACISTFTGTLKTAAQT